MQQYVNLKYAGTMILGAVLLFLLFAGSRGDQTNLITPADAKKLVESDSSAVVLDVRTPAEFSGETGHLKNALLLPVQELEGRVGELDKFKSRTIIVYCRSGHRSTTATEILEKHGFKARNMQGGITRWKQENLPIVLEPAQPGK
jgi:rhodanese-related sulfurtransferase